MFSGSSSVAKARRLHRCLQCSRADEMQGHQLWYLYPLHLYGERGLPRGPFYRHVIRREKTRFTCFSFVSVALPLPRSPQMFPVNISFSTARWGIWGTSGSVSPWVWLLLRLNGSECEVKNRSSRCLRIKVLTVHTHTQRGRERGREGGREGEGKIYILEENDTAEHLLCSALKEMGGKKKVK